MPGTKPAAELAGEDKEALVTHLRERTEQYRGLIAAPYIVAAELIRSMTYGAEQVPSAALLVVLDALDEATR